MAQAYDYSLYQTFAEKYISGGFLTVDRRDPLVAEMEDVLKQHRQLFYVADLIRMKITFCTEGSREILGVAPEEMDAGSIFRALHPDDHQRHGLGRAHLFKKANELIINKGGISMLSTCLRLNNGSGKYANTLYSSYSFYSEIPRQTVYMLVVLTDLSAFKLRKLHNHFYAGNDATMFRYPDETMLQQGYFFSEREFEIIKLISRGMDSLQIAGELFVSVNTVNTHRRNILKKIDKPTTHELIIELQGKGYL